MKVRFILILIICLSTFLGCKKSNVRLNYGCHADRPVLENISNRKAKYIYDTRFKIYVLNNGTPQCIDCDNRYVICNPPGQKLVKNASYVFSGETRKSDFRGEFGGQEYFELTLTAINQP